MNKTSRRSVLAGLSAAFALRTPTDSNESHIERLIADHRAASAEQLRASAAVEEKLADLPDDVALGPEIPGGHKIVFGERQPIMMRSLAQIDEHVERLARSFDGVDKAHAYRLRGNVRDRLRADFAAEAARIDLLAEESGLAALRDAEALAFERAESALDELFAEPLTSLEDCRALAAYACDVFDERGWTGSLLHPLAHAIAGRPALLRIVIG